MGDDVLRSGRSALRLLERSRRPGVRRAFVGASLAAAMLMLSSCGGRSGSDLTLTSLRAPVPSIAPNPAASLDSVMCRGGTCTAVGVFAMDRSGDEASIAYREQSGAWRGVRLPIPPSSEKNGPIGSSIRSMACPTVRECEAFGSYEGGGRSMIESERDGIWRTRPFPWQGRAGVIACPAAGSCYGTSSAGGHAYVVRLRSGHWSRVRAPVPSGVPSWRSNALSSIACMAVDRCVAVGAFGTQAGSPHPYAVIVARGWQRAVRVSTPSPAFAHLDDIRCPTRRGCIAIGLSLPPWGGRYRAFAATLGHAGWRSVWLPGALSSTAYWTPTSLGPLACAGVRLCVASATVPGSYRVGDRTVLFRLRNSRWVRSSPPPPAGPLHATVHPAACVRTACYLGGSYEPTGYSPRNALLLETSGSQWRPVSVALPNNRGPGPASLRALWCGRRDCMATGTYTDRQQNQQAFISFEAGGHWTSTEAPGRAWMRGGPAPNSELGVVSCPVARRCSALGRAHGFVVADALEGGHWGTRVIALPTGLRSPGKFLGIDCVSPHDCVAVGDARTTEDAQWSEIVMQHGHRWVSVEAPSSPRTGRGERLLSVSCPASSACEAAGWSRSLHGRREAFVSMEGQDHRWTGLAAGPAPRSSRRMSILTAISCRQTRRCVAVGRYEAPGRGILPLVEETHAHGTRPEPLALPGNALGTSIQDAGLSTVSCVPRSGCVALGSYITRGHQGEGLIAIQTGHRWMSFEAPNARGPHSAIAIKRLVCQADGGCVAIGTYDTGVCSRCGILLTGVDKHWHSLRFGLDLPKRITHPSGWKSFDEEYDAVSCPPSGSCQVVGAYGVDSRANTFILTLDPADAATAGTHWRRLRPGRQAVVANSLSCALPTWCVAVGHTTGWPSVAWIGRPTRSGSG